MTWAPAPRPQWVVDQIAIGRRLGPTRWHRLDADELVATASEIAGSDDFGEPSWRPGFATLCDALQHEARLHAVGAALTRSEMLRTLVNRLRIVASTNSGSSGSAGSRPIVAPLVVCGTARSGTSILHELLAQDPALRAPRAWEIMYSVPTAHPAAGDTRVDDADREVRHWDEIAPEYLRMHENGGALPQECIFITAHEFASEHWSGVHDVPSYHRWLRRADLVPAYRWHERQLGWLQGADRSTQWVLKAPSHLSALPALFAVYPDAWIIQTHRDPLRTVPSTISLMATLRWMRSDHVDVDRLAATMSKGVAALFDWVTAMRHDGTLPDERFVDVRYADLMRDPVAAIRAVYERIGLPFEGDRAGAIERYLAAKPRGRHGVHHYSAGDFGLDAGELRARYRDYCDAYGVEPEPA